jgi:hypothetical protein
MKGELYFCKVGGQFYSISENESDYCENMAQEVFERDKSNFKISIQSIENVKINGRKSLWTGKIHNEGTVVITHDGDCEKFIIHRKQNSEEAANFFKSVNGIKVDSVHTGRAAKKKSDDYISGAVRRSAEYKDIHKATKYLNALGWVIGFWLMFYPNPYLPAVILNILLPIAGIFVYIKFNRYVELDDDRGEENPNVGAIVFIPSLALLARALLDFNLFYETLFWVCTAGITLIMLVIILMKTSEYKRNRWVPLALAFVIFPYVLGTMVLTNCLFDRSDSERYSSYITDKYISTGKTKTYNITIEPWGPVTETEDIIVGKSFYENAKKGQRIYLNLKGGAWGFKWFVPDEFSR